MYTQIIFSSSHTHTHLHFSYPIVCCVVLFISLQFRNNIRKKREIRWNGITTMLVPFPHIE